MPFIDILTTLKDELLAKLGEHKTSKNEIKFKVCPYCGNAKFNFEVNFSKGVFGCWVCNVGGSIKRLCRDQGVVYDSNAVLFETIDKKVRVEKPQQPVLAQDNILESAIELPKGYKFYLSEKRQQDFRSETPEYKSYQYLYGRGITDEMISRYQIMYWDYRVLFPFHDILGELNFWTARTVFDGVEPKYLHASVDKNELIVRYCGSSAEVYIVEGVFDAIELNKSDKDVIMALGSSVSESVIFYLRLSKRKVVLCLDNDMLGKQVKLLDKLKNILGPDKVDGFFLKAGDVAEYGMSESSGGLGLAGFIKAKIGK